MRGRKGGEVSVEERETGMVKRFNPTKGYCVIMCDQGGDVFVHYSAIRGRSYRSLEEGQNYYSDKNVCSPCIWAKIYPVNHTNFTVQACLAPNLVSGGIVPWDQAEKYSWVNALENIRTDVSALMQSSHHLVSG